MAGPPGTIQPDIRYGTYGGISTVDCMEFVLWESFTGVLLLLSMSVSMRSALT